MRLPLMLVVFAALAPGSLPSERVQGFLTFGCDSYLRPRNIPETWYVDLPPTRRYELLRMANVTMAETPPWMTLYVDVEGKLSDTPRPGYVGVHPKQLNLARVLSARYLVPGESVDAAIQSAKHYEGFLLAGPHGFGFVPFEQKDELWWAVAGRVGWSDLSKNFPSMAKHLDQARVTLLGRVGPPGSYGNMSDYSREIAVDELKFIQRVKPEELAGTAGILDTREPSSGIPAINRCVSSQPGK